MKKENFCNNLKRIIKKKGLKLGSFAPIYLKMSSQTFGHQLKNNNLKIETIEKILSILNVTFEEVQKGYISVDSNTDINKPINPVITNERSDKAKPKQAINKNKYKGLKGLL